MFSRTLNRAFLLTVVMLLISQIGAFGGKVIDGSDQEQDSTFRERVRFDTQISELKLVKIGDMVHLTLEGLEPFTEPGQPMLPMEPSVIEYDKNVDILEVSASSESRIRVQGVFDIAPTPQPLTWGTDFAGIYEKDLETYALDEYFPGLSFSYTIGEDDERKYVYINFYPVQYNPRRGEIALISQLSIEILYAQSADIEPLADDLTAECIIITPASLYSEAKQLADFHESSLGIPTSVVNTTWIEANYAEASDPPFPGYKDAGLPGRWQILNYDYSLAKKTISFLNNQSAHPNMSSVLLYGNAELVPPSYYFYDVEYGPYSAYEGWIPTDHFYGSPDLDLTPNYAVGRLPVDGITRATHVNLKIEDWHSNLSPAWFENVAIAGGRPFNTIFYVGELINQDSLNSGYFDGFNVTKMHATDGRFGKTLVMDALKGEVGIFYEIGHGSGDALYLNDSSPPPEVITVMEVLSLPANSNVSVFVSIACDNGAFDNTMMSNRPFPSTISFGESLIFSNAGAIAYIGGSRSNSGTPMGYLDEGEVRITGERYMASMLTGFWRAFHGGADTLGEISMNAMADFAAQKNMGDPYNQRAFFEYVLLGDPVLPMAHPLQSGHSVPSTDIDKFSGFAQKGTPWIMQGDVPVVRLMAPNTLNVTTSSPNVGFKMIDADFDITLGYDSDTTLNNETKYAFTPTRNSLLLLRAETDDGKEGWQYMVSTFIPDHPKAPQLLLADLNGASNQDVVISWYKSTDEGDPQGSTRYEVYRSSSISGPYTKIADKTATGQASYVVVDPGRGDGDPSGYFYYVTAYNSTGESSRSYYAAKYSKHMTEGWHLVSLPVIPDDRSTGRVFRTLDFNSIAVYDPSDVDDPWKRYDSFKSYDDLVRVNHRMGLWVEAASDDYWAVAGLVPNETQIQLLPGWNLIGNPTFSPGPVVMELAGVNYERIEGYQLSSDPYCLQAMMPNDYMETGEAYWVKVSSTQILTIVNPP